MYIKLTETSTFATTSLNGASSISGIALDGTSGFTYYAKKTIHQSIATSL
jgi:hypothetical protein